MRDKHRMPVQSPRLVFPLPRQLDQRLEVGLRSIGAHRKIGLDCRSATLADRRPAQDLAAAMVRLGMAWAFVRYSLDYVEVEPRARAENLGVHAHSCQPAREWRAQPRQQ